MARTSIAPWSPRVRIIVPEPRKSLEPWIKDSVKYYDHQVDGVRKLSRMESFLLADDMGLGKTLQALTVFAIDVIMKRANQAIVVCPVTLKGNWISEIDVFTRFSRVELGRGPHRPGKSNRPLAKAARDKQLAEFAKISGPKILVVNYEQVVSHLSQLNRMGFDIAIFDEAHYMKSPGAKRTKACINLRASRSFMLTGSPLLNQVDELWTILHRIDPVMYPNYFTFRSRYCVFGGYKDKEIIGIQNENELTMRLQSVMLRRLKKDVLDLPDTQIIKRQVDLAPEQQKMYDEAIEELRITRVDDLSPLDIENGMVKLLRLKQICGTTATLLGPDHDVSSKLDLAINDAVELIGRGEKVIVFTQFREVQASYTRRLLKATKAPIWELHGNVEQSMRQPTVDAWSAHDGPSVIVCMLQVAGIGLNMVAARYLQFLDKLFVPKLNQQAIDRAHRIGQNLTEPVTVLEYIARDTIELRVEQINKTKTKLFNDVIETSSWKRLLLAEIMKND